MDCLYRRHGHNRFALQPWVEEAQLHHLSAAYCAAAVTFGSELLLLADSLFAAVFVPATAGLFLPPTADFLYLRLFSLPTGRRGWGMAANVRERALDDFADSHIRKGRSPEKPQIFLYIYHADYAYDNRRRHFFLAI